MIFLIEHPVISENMLPLTFTRLIEDVRVGILTLREKWQFLMKRSEHISLLSEYRTTSSGLGTFVYSHIIPTDSLLEEILQLSEGDVLLSGSHTVAFCGTLALWETSPEGFRTVQVTSPVKILQTPFDLIRENSYEIKVDFHLVTEGRRSAKIPEHNRCEGSQHIFVEDGAVLRFSTLVATENAPIYIGKDVTVMENALLKEGVCLSRGATVKPGGIICGGTTIGSFCKVGGEISNSIFFSYSNKAHHGFVGNSIIGAWCNLGAGTSVSNLKNNYSPVSLWNYREKALSSKGNALFFGTLMGDHSKTGINTSLNTGTSIGVSSSILSGHLPPKHIPSFVWDNGEIFSEYILDKALETAHCMMQRRSLHMMPVQTTEFENIFKTTAEERRTFLKNKAKQAHAI